MAIRVWSYLETLEAERAETRAAIEEVLASGRLILGPRLRSFEANFASYCGVAHGVGVGNGTDALFLALQALGVGAGDEVVTVANTAVPTVSAIVASGAVPRFVDIDPATYLMDVDRLDEAIGAATRCVVPVHLYGQCVDMATVREIAAARDVRVLEDCAQSHGARRRGRVSGSMADAAAFSFYPTKVLGGYGDGGMVVTDDEELAARVRRLRHYGMEDRYYAEESGHNSRLDELHAAILDVKLTHLDSYLERRRAIAARYDAELAETSLVLPRTALGNEHAYYLYVVRHPRRDQILQSLAADRDIHLNVSYPWPIHTMRAYRGLGYAEGDLPETEAAAREIFSLPMYPGLADEDQTKVIEALKSLT